MRPRRGISRLTRVTQDWQGKLIEELTIPEGFEEPYSLSGAARSARRANVGVSSAVPQPRRRLALGV